jgi:hypothetical protein
VLTECEVRSGPRPLSGSILLVFMGAGVGAGRFKLMVPATGVGSSPVVTSFALGSPLWQYQC